MALTARRPRHPRAGDRGAVAVEVAIATPLLLLLIAVVVQFALWYHATHTAEAIARQSLATARLADTTAVAAQDQASSIADQLGSGTLTDPAVIVDRQLDATTVTVSGTAAQVLPFVTIPVETTVSGPTERFRPPDGTSP